MAKYVTTPLAPWTKVLKDPLKKALYAEIKKLHLKPVKRLHFQFDPFHDSVLSIRQFLTAVSAPKKRASNPKCGVKIEVLSNREDPKIVVNFENGHSAIFKTSLLTTLEITQHFNRLVTQFDPPESDSKLPGF